MRHAFCCMERSPLIMMHHFRKSALAAVFAMATASIAAPDTLSVWIMPNGASPQEKLEQRLEGFTQKTGIQTKVTVLDWGEAWNRISEALETGENAPDVLQLGTTWVPYFATRHTIKPLNGWLGEIDSTRFVPVSWGTTHIDGDTTIYSLPWFIDIRAVLANKRILKEYGITKESVATYNGFVKAIRKINDAKEKLPDGTIVKGYAFPGKSDWNIPHNFAPWIWSNGGSFIAKDNDGKWHANILSNKTLLGITRYLNFIMQDIVSTDALQANTAQIAQFFNNGELAFIVNSSEIVMQTRFDEHQGGLSTSRIGADSVMVVPIPKGSVGSVSFIGGSNLAIPAKNTRKEAKDLLLFLTTDENLDAYTRQIGLLPSSKKVLDTWAEDEDYRELVSALNTGRAYKAIPEWGDLEQLFVSMFSSVWEQVEVPSLYSPEKIYEIFKQYTIEINKKLDYPSNNIMTLAEFEKVWTPMIKTSVEESNDEDSEDDSETNSIVSNNLAKAPFVFLVMIILGFIFNFRRKSKNSR